MHPNIGRVAATTRSSRLKTTVLLKDERVRANVAMSPAGVLLTAESLAAIRLATMDTPGIALPGPDGTVAANPPGFDRNAFLKQLAVEITAFFDKTLR